MMLRLLVVIAGSVMCRGDVLTVCDLLATMPAHDKEVIQVRGRYVAGPEAEFIADQRCRTQVNHKDQKWEPGIWLAFPNAPNKPSKEQFDFDAFDTLIKASRDAKSKGQVATATFTGRLRYCPIRATIRPGDIRWIGCGFLGYYPLEIVVTTVSDIHVESLGLTSK
jgi:hypothetical protein